MSKVGDGPLEMYLPDAVSRFRQALGDSIQDLRELKKVSVSQAATHSNIRVRSMREFENGTWLGLVPMAKFVSLTRYYGVEVMPTLIEAVKTAFGVTEERPGIEVEALLFFCGAVPGQILDPDWFNAVSDSVPDYFSFPRLDFIPTYGEAGRLQAGVLMRRRYQQGETVREVSDHVGVSYGCGRTLFHEVGGVLRPSGPIKYALWTPPQR